MVWHHVQQDLHPHFVRRSNQVLVVTQSAEVVLDSVFVDGVIAVIVGGGVVVFI